MRLPRSPAHAAILSSFLFPLVALSNTLDCQHVRTEKFDWSFESLGGPKSVLHAVSETASWVNTTYTIDLCKPLKRKDDVPDNQKCPGGTRCKLLLDAASRLRGAGFTDQKQCAVSSA